MLQLVLFRVGLYQGHIYYPSNKNRKFFVDDKKTSGAENIFGTARRVCLNISFLWNQSRAVKRLASQTVF